MDAINAYSPAILFAQIVFKGFVPPAKQDSEYLIRNVWGFVAMESN